MYKKWFTIGLAVTAVMVLGLGLNSSATAQSSLNCQVCHGDVYDRWAEGVHAHTQTGVAAELAEERAGQTANEVIQGDDPENCIACHAPAATLANEGMTEAQALDYFFTTVDGKFTEDTAAINTADWQSVACTTCHNVPNDHPASMPTLALFDSQMGEYAPVGSASELCGQCHGGVRSPDTDHLTYNAWTTSRHSETQADVASELAEERGGQSADEVVHGEDPENCVACHAPTAVLANGGMSEAEALDYFFTTVDGKFAADTAPTNSSEWPSVSCTACHDQHNPGEPAYFNSSTNEYEPMENADELCGQCHGNLRFSNTDHLSYNIRSGAGGIGVPDQQTMPSATCTDCHMFASDVDGSDSSMFHGHTWDITVTEADGNSATSCTRCHAGRDAAEANVIIGAWKSSFQSLDDIAQKNVAAAAKAMEGVEDKALQANLEEAQHNLEYAESDESGGFHNHEYLMSLLNDANDKALKILSVGMEADNVFSMPLTQGLNMISLPLKPVTSYTARSFAEMLSATLVIKLDEARQRFVGFTLDAPDDGFAIEGGKGYIVNVPESAVVTFTGAAWTNQPPVEAAPSLVQNDGAWAFVVNGKLESDTKDGYFVTIRNTRTNAVVASVVRSGYFAPAFVDLNRKNVVQIGDRLEVKVGDQAGEIVSDTLSYTVTAEAIRQAFLPIILKNVEAPRQTVLLQNYPNPFNPETWIPYQLREPAEVAIRIYDIQGRVVRTLSLGQRAAGFYLDRTRAAYWDGLNFAGEKVVSGVYFYQIKASGFSATRRMLVVR